MWQRCVAGTWRLESPLEKNTGFPSATAVDLGMSRVKDTMQATRCFFCRFEKSFFLSHRKEKWREMKMRQTKNEAIPKEASLVGLRNIHMTFQTAFRLIVQYLAAKKKRENETFVLVLNRAYILKCN